MIKKIVASAMLVVVAAAAHAVPTVTASVLANEESSTFLRLVRLAPSTATPGVVAGGTLHNGPADSSIAAIPQDTLNGIATIGTWLSVGPSSGNTATVFLGAGTSFVSFLWGSPDTYNSLVVNTDDGSHFTFDSDNLGGIVFNSVQSEASYVGFTVDTGFLITSLTFSSGQDAFEASNFSVTTPIPEPATYALMLAGLGAIGIISRRRKA